MQHGGLSAGRTRMTMAMAMATILQREPVINYCPPKLTKIIIDNLLLRQQQAFRGAHAQSHTTPTSTAAATARELNS